MECWRLNPGPLYAVLSAVLLVQCANKICITNRDQDKINLLKLFIGKKKKITHKLDIAFSSFVILP